jgi:hypothetical protein
MDAPKRLTTLEHQMMRALQELLSWADEMGGWDAPCWRQAAHVLERAQILQRAMALRANQRGAKR